MYCTKCGKKNHAAAIFCDYCGAELPDELGLSRKNKDNLVLEELHIGGVQAAGQIQVVTEEDTDHSKVSTKSSGRKNTDYGLAATIMFGPVGLFYATTVGGFVMLVLVLISILLAITDTISFPIFLMLIFAQWVICLVWRAIAVKKYQPIDETSSS